MFLLESHGFCEPEKGVTPLALRATTSLEQLDMDQAAEFGVSESPWTLHMDCKPCHRCLGAHEFL